jgi:hypothetical protein
VRKAHAKLDAVLCSKDIRDKKDEAAIRKGAGYHEIGEVLPTTKITENAKEGASSRRRL